MATRSRYTSDRAHRFDKFQARVAALQAAVDPETPKERNEFLEFLDQQVVLWYRSHQGRIHVVTGALLRALTARGDSARVLSMTGNTVTLIIKHPGMYHIPHIVAPRLDFASAMSKARAQFLAWRARQ